MYKKGKEIYMADTLSQVYLLREAGETRSTTDIEAESIRMLQFVPVREQTLTEINKEVDDYLRACKAFNCPAMNKEIMANISKCAISNAYRPAQRK